jgi:transposase
VASTGRSATTTSPWSTRTARWWPSGASARAAKGSLSCSRCSLPPATTRPSRSWWRSRHHADYWSPPCAPAAAPSTPSTHWRWPGTGSGPASPARSPTTPTRWSWRTSCAPTPHLHRPLPADTELARSIAVLARASQDATWRRTRASNELRSLLREYYPAFLQAVAGRTGNLTNLVARAVLAAVPTPAAAATVTKAKLTAAVRRAGRVRGIETLVDELHAALRCPQLRQDRLVEEAMGAQALRLLASLDVECVSVEQLAEATMEAFRRHPDHAIITSFPGLADLTGARVLGELGDDRARFADARSVKAFAGSAPVTRASGRSVVITHRRVKNFRLAAVGFTWSFAALTCSTGGRAHYDRRRTAGDSHAAASRHLFNRMLGCLYHCLQTNTRYDETSAFTTQPVFQPGIRTTQQNQDQRTTHLCILATNSRVFASDAIASPHGRVPIS